MKFVVEERIPYIKGILESAGEVSYLPTEEITPLAVRHADVLLVRTRTRCDAALLSDSRVRFIGSATIGTDHIDQKWCRQHGITVRNAPGCNAPAVAQWVFSSIALWLERHAHKGTDGLTLGVIGVGHVGSIVARWATQLGFGVLLNDPPLGLGCSLEHLLTHSDIITVHTPLSHDGPWPTWHLLGERQLQGMTRCGLLINAARGGIIDEHALLQWPGELAIDCWLNEPHPLTALVTRALVATPHIAGYSVEGKMRGTAMMLQALNEHYGWQLPIPPVAAPAQGAHSVTMAGVLGSFDPRPLTVEMKGNSDNFESMRNSYPLRHEYISSDAKQEGFIT